MPFGMLENQQGTILVFERVQDLSQIQIGTGCFRGSAYLPFRFGLLSCSFVLASPSASAPDGQASPYSDPVDPGAVLAAPFKFRASQKQADEDFLGRVLRVLGVAKQPVADPPHALLESLYHSDEGGAIRTFAHGFGCQL